MATEDNSLLHEIDESLRQERVERFWQENGNYVIGTVILAILLTAAISGFRVWNEKLHDRETAALIKNLSAEDTSNILDETYTSGGPEPGIRALTALTLASRFGEDGAIDKARGAYQKAAADKAAPSELRDLATLLSVQLSGEEGNLDPQDLLNKLVPLTEERNPWRFHAHFQSALINGHRIGNKSKAREHLSVILGSENVPQSLVQRATALDHVFRQKENS